MNAKTETVTTVLSRVYVDIPAEAHLAAKLEAMKAGMSLKAWVEQAILNSLPKKKK